MRSDIGKLLQLSIRAGQVRRGCVQALVSELASCDVTNVADDERILVFRSHRAEADFDRKLRPVAAQAEQLQTRAHRPCVRIALVPRAMTRMPSTEALGQEHLYRSPEQLRAWVAEQELGLTVHDLNQARGVDNNHSIGRRLQ